MHAAFGPQIVQRYYQGQQAHAARFLQKMLDPSADCKTELRLCDMFLEARALAHMQRRSIGRVIFELTYGLPVEEHFKEVRAYFIDRVCSNDPSSAVQSHERHHPACFS